MAFKNSPVCTFSSIHENWRFSFIFCLEIKAKVSPGKQFSLQFKESLFAHSHCFKRHFTILIESNPSNSLYSKRNLSVCLYNIQSWHKSCSTDGHKMEAQKTSTVLSNPSETILDCAVILVLWPQLQLQVVWCCPAQRHTSTTETMAVMLKLNSHCGHLVAAGQAVNTALTYYHPILLL